MSRKILPLNRALKKYTEVEMVAEYRFHPFREWRFDYAIPELKIALEVEGGTSVPTASGATWKNTTRPLPSVGSLSG